MAIERWRPFATSVERWEPFREIQSEMNRLFDGFFGRPTAIERDGVLEVKLPKADEVKPKEIKIDIL
jgi:hypothetical protein